jgi:hypothetical protein
MGEALSLHLFLRHSRERRDGDESNLKRDNRPDAAPWHAAQTNKEQQHPCQAHHARRKKGGTES